MIALTTVDVTKSYKGRKVVHDVSLAVGQGEVVGLLGPNGAGKTTTFYMIVGLTRPDSGSVLLGEHDITDLPMYLRAQNGISYLPQEASVFRKLTVESNIMAILETLPLSGQERRDSLEGRRRRVVFPQTPPVEGAILRHGSHHRNRDPEDHRSFETKQIGVLITDHN